MILEQISSWIFNNTGGIEVSGGMVGWILGAVGGLTGAFALSKFLTPKNVDAVIAWLDKKGVSKGLDYAGTVVSAVLTRWCGAKAGQKIEDFFQASIPKIVSYFWSKFCVGLDKDDKK